MGRLLPLRLALVAPVLIALHASAEGGGSSGGTSPVNGGAAAMGGAAAGAFNANPPPGAGPGAGAAPNPPPAPQSNPPPASSAALPNKPPRVVGLKGSEAPRGRPILEDGESLTFEIENLAALRSSATVANPITLFVDDRPLKGCAAQTVVGKADHVRFDLQWTEDSRQTWTHLLGRVGESKVFKSTVGLLDGSVVAAGSEEVDAGVVRWRLRWVLIGSVLFASGLLLRHAGVRRVLRASSAERVSDPLPYSLGRVQMAWWFANILIAYLLIWATVGAIDTITPQMLVLMGIGAGTALGAVAIDASKLERAQSEAAAARAALLISPTNAELQKAVEAAEVTLARLSVEKMPKSEGFLNDILSDNAGFSLHRFQMVVWTLVVTTIFWYSVWRDLAMPQLGDTLLGLMGISAGTYLGFKFPEK